MTSLQDLINLAKADGGKFVVLDSNGDPKLVIMPIEEYQRLLLGKLQQQVLDIEKINQEIIKAQLQEEPIAPAKSITPNLEPSHPVAPHGNGNGRSIPDLREEVIDPSFDFEGPRINLEDL